MTSVTPLAKEQYDRREEQNFREWVRRNLSDRLGRQEAPTYPGIPVMMVNGTDASWDAPTGATPTKVPFNTVMAEKSSHVFDTTNSHFTLAFSGAYRAYFHLFHNGGGANKTVDIAICAFNNGVEASRNTVQRALDQVWNVEGTFISVLVADDVLDLRVVHTETVDVTFDLTYSRLMLEQLTANPSYVDRTRV